MENISIKQQIIESIDTLTQQQQKKLLEFINAFIGKKRRTKNKLAELAGSIDKKDLKLMKKAIEEDCEKINKDEW